LKAVAQTTEDARYKCNTYKVIFGAMHNVITQGELTVLRLNQVFITHTSHDENYLNYFPKNCVANHLG